MLDRLVQGALAGDAVLALLEGPAGIGKSTLLAESREKAAAAGFRAHSRFAWFQGLDGP